MRASPDWRRSPRTPSETHRMETVHRHAPQAGERPNKPQTPANPEPPGADLGASQSNASPPAPGAGQPIVIPPEIAAELQASGTRSAARTTGRPAPQSPHASIPSRRGRGASFSACCRSSDSIESLHHVMPRRRAQCRSSARSCSSTACLCWRPHATPACRRASSARARRRRGGGIRTPRYQESARRGWRGASRPPRIHSRRNPGPASRVLGAVPVGGR
jgi:hypothetical protein